MKLSSFSAIILLHVATSSIFFISPTQSTFQKQGMVENICRKTPHYDLCVFTLKSNLQPPQQKSSPNAAGFAKIALDVVFANSTAALDLAHKARTQTKDAQINASLDSCVASYTRIVKELLPEAIKCMDKGDYKGVKRNTYIAGNIAGSCEDKCKESSSSVMTDANVYVQNLCSIASSIVSRLPQSPHQTLA